MEESPERLALLRAIEALAEDDQVAPNMRCANCGHAAAAHEGDDNMGACTVEDCGCDGMQPPSETEDDSETAAADAPAVLQLENVQMDAEAVLPETPAAVSGYRWSADAVFEGTLTDDGRAFAPGALTWRELPLTLGAMLDTPHADMVMESRACGRIDRIYRVGQVLRAEGVFDEGEFGQEIARMISDGTLRGISVDVAVKDAEVAPMLDFFDEDGNWRDERIETGEPEQDLLEVLFGPSDESAQLIWVVTEGVIGAITVCPFPAFADARIEIAASLAASMAPNVWTFTKQHGMTVTALKGEDGKELVASAVAAPVAPPSAWFEDPELDELTALTITDEGRVYGHAAPWDTCHIAIPDVCTTAPHSVTDYDFFHLKEIVCEDVERIYVGTITLGTGHAGRGLNSVDATAHYDNTGTAVVDVRCGEDEHGIWVAGALRSDLSEEQVRQLRGAVLSGDWRQVEFTDGTRNLELVALLAVNVPGFPVPRTRALVAAGEDGLEVVALTAAGIHAGVDEEVQLEKVKAIGATEKYAALAERARGAA